jgi:mono/diheme cytochrome c family protein
MEAWDRNLELARVGSGIAIAALAFQVGCDRGQSGDRPAARTAKEGSSAGARAPSAEDPCVASHRLRQDAGIVDSGMELTRQAQMDFGFQVFASVCVTCHQPSGRGFPNAFPPLAGSDFLMADKGRSIDILLSGWNQPITVNDRPYSAVMPSFGCFSDVEIASVLTYVRNTWGNAGDPVTSREVGEHRARAMKAEVHAPR